MTSRKFLWAPVAAFSITLFGTTAATAEDSRNRELKVMTYNMYLGTDFTEIFQSQTLPEVFSEVAEAYGDVEAGLPHERISEIADQIQAAEPTLVGLQEVALWRLGEFGNPAPSTTVGYDFLQILLDELTERGLHYAPVAVHTGFDAEVPGTNGTTFFQDVRYTDRVVILARTDLSAAQLRVEHVETGAFTNLFTVPTVIGNITVERAWTLVDAKLRGKTYRFVNAHLESFHPLINVAQGEELLAGPANTDRSVILVGDLNSDASTGGATYTNIRNAGFADSWSDANPTLSGNTWPLFDPTPNVFATPIERLDLILTRGKITTDSADLFGEHPVDDVTPSGLRPSDHSAVASLLVLQP